MSRIDVLNKRVARVLNLRGCGDTSPEEYDDADAALSDLVATAKEDADGCDMCAQYLDDAGASDLDARKARARAEQAEKEAEKILPADEVCACLDETGGRQVRIFERCERCHALMESDLPEQLAEQSESADEWREQWERAEQRSEVAERALKDAQMKERALTDYFADASRRADEWQERAEQAGRQIALIKTHLNARCEHLVERAERVERERDAVHVRLCEERDRVAELEAALYAAPQPEAVRNGHTDGEYHERYERTRRAALATRRAALASPDPKEGT